MKVSQLPANRELDILIAQKVFGWICLDEFPNEQVKSHGWGAPSVDATLRIVPHYSTDIAAAFQVVDKLLDGTRAFSLECWSLTADYWDVTFEGPLNDEACQYERLGFARAETMPLAICRAALKVMEGK